MKQRISWNEYFLQSANLAAQRSTCIRRQVGAVIVKNKHILATGYNGAPSGADHCLDIGCIREELEIPSGERHELCRAVHAEQNAIIQAAYHGVSIAGSDIYCTCQPCSICAKMIVNCGIKTVFCQEVYPDSLAISVLESAGIAIYWYCNKTNIMIQLENKGE